VLFVEEGGVLQREFAQASTADDYAFLIKTDFCAGNRTKRDQSDKK
jgi:hypothetical protein